MNEDELKRLDEQARKATYSMVSTMKMIGKSKEWVLSATSPFPECPEAYEQYCAIVEEVYGQDGKVH